MFYERMINYHVTHFFLFLHNDTRIGIFCYNNLFVRNYTVFTDSVYVRGVSVWCLLLCGGKTVPYRPPPPPPPPATHYLRQSITVGWKSCFWVVYIRRPMKTLLWATMDMTCLRKPLGFNQSKTANLFDRPHFETASFRTAKYLTAKIGPPRQVWRSQTVVSVSPVDKRVKESLYYK